MLNVCSFISKANVLNLSDACYSYRLPNLTENSQKKITFIYGTKEIARFAIPFRTKWLTPRFLAQEAALSAIQKVLKEK